MLRVRARGIYGVCKVHRRTCRSRLPSRGLLLLLLLLLFLLLLLVFFFAAVCAADLNGPTLAESCRQLHPGRIWPWRPGVRGLVSKRHARNARLPLLSQRPILLDSSRTTRASSGLPKTGSC